MSQPKSNEEWGEGLEELINNIRRHPDTDSVHIHEYVRTVLAQKDAEVAEAVKSAIELLTSAHVSTDLVWKRNDTVEKLKALTSKE